MKLQALIGNIYLSIISALYLIPDKSTPSDKESFTVSWMIQHMGPRGNYPNYKFDNKQQSNYLPKDCKIEQIQLIIRHGTRYPVSNAMKAINNALAILKQSNNSDSLDLLGWVKTYKNEYLYHRTGQLDTTGQHEQYLIGRRFSRTYRQFMQGLVDSDQTIITQQLGVFSSWSVRTLQSAQAFCLGAFVGSGTLGPTKLVTVPVFSFKENNDSLIALHKSCPRWQKEAKALTNKIVEPVVQRLLGPVASRLQNQIGIPITVTNVLDFHSGCTSEVAIHRTIDTFCRLFTRQDILKLEYLDDLKRYYKYSYGLPELNEEMACDLGKHIMANINEAVDKDEQAYKLNVKFGHSETLLALRTLLGLYQGRLSPHSSEQEVETRQFRLSNFGYFANNVAIQLLSKRDKFFVQVIENEQLILLPGCKNVLCPLDQFRAIMETKTQCNFIDNCRMNVI